MKRFLATMFLAAACTSSPPQVTHDPMDMRPSTTSCIADGKTATVTGRYAVLASLQVDIQVPPSCAKENTCLVHTNGNSSLLLLASIVQNGTKAQVLTQSCDIHIPQVPIKGSDLPIVLKASPSLLESIPPATAVATLEGTTTCSKFVAQPLNFLFGANLATPISDALPAFSAKNTPPVAYCGASATIACATSTAPTPPKDTGCVCDQDGDGRAGATLSAMNIPVLSDIDQVYVDLRNSVTLSGTVLQPDVGQSQVRIGGKVLGLRMEQNVLGCHRSGPNRDCDNNETNAAATLSPGILQSTNGESTFLAVPVPETMTCAEVIAQRTKLFPQN